MKTKLTNKDVDDRLIGRSIIRVEDYNGISNKIKWKCLKDGHEWLAMPDQVIGKYKTGCPICAGGSRFNNEIIDNKIKNKNIKRLDNYINNMTKINWQCLKCDHIWLTSFISISKHNCPACAGLTSMKVEEVDKKLLEKNIIRIDQFINNNKRISVKCLKDNYVWKTTAYSLLNDKRPTGCPLCCALSGEKRLHYLLRQIVPEDTIKKNKFIKINKVNVFIDFVIEINKTKIFIERHGEQHYKPVRFKGISLALAKKRYKKQIKRDSMVREYFRENNQLYIEIPYWFTKNETFAAIQSVVATLGSPGPIIVPENSAACQTDNPTTAAG